MTLNKITGLYSLNIELMKNKTLRAGKETVVECSCSIQEALGSIPMIIKKKRKEGNKEKKERERGRERKASILLILKDKSRWKK